VAQSFETPAHSRSGSLAHNFPCSRAPSPRSFCRGAANGIPQIELRPFSIPSFHIQDSSLQIAPVCDQLKHYAGSLAMRPPLVGGPFSFECQRKRTSVPLSLIENQFVRNYTMPPKSTMKKMEGSEVLDIRAHVQWGVQRINGPNVASRASLLHRLRRMERGTPPTGGMNLRAHLELELLPNGPKRLRRARAEADSKLETAPLPHFQLSGAPLLGGKNSYSELPKSTKERLRKIATARYELQLIEQTSRRYEALLSKPTGTAAGGFGAGSAPVPVNSPYPNM
jgi:hypothetical protein